MAGLVSYEEELRATGADLERLVRRLQLFTPRTWREHREGIQGLLAELVRLAGAVEGRSLVVPDLPDHVLADAVAVIGGDLVGATEPPISEAVLAKVRALLCEALASTR